MQGAMNRRRRRPLPNSTREPTVRSLRELSAAQRPNRWPGRRPCLGGLTLGRGVKSDDLTSGLEMTAVETSGTIP